MKSKRRAMQPYDFPEHGGVSEPANRSAEILLLVGLVASPALMCGMMVLITLVLRG